MRHPVKSQLPRCHDSGVKELTSSETTRVWDGFAWAFCHDATGKKSDGVYVGENKGSSAKCLARTRTRTDPQGTLAERLPRGGAGIPGFIRARRTNLTEGKEAKKFGDME